MHSELLDCSKTTNGGEYSMAYLLFEKYSQPVVAAAAAAAAAAGADEQGVAVWGGTLQGGGRGNVP